MERATALKKLQRILGPSVYWRIGAELSSPERRRKAELTRLDAAFQLAMLQRDRLDLRDRLLASLEYQTLTAECEQAKHALDHAPSPVYYRFTVGTRSAMGEFTLGHQRAQGDTWEEVFAQLTQKASK